MNYASALHGNGGLGVDASANGDVRTNHDGAACECQAVEMGPSAAVIEGMSHSEVIS